MKTLLNIDKWNRKEHFNFFNQFDEPYFGIVVDIECSRAYKYCKEQEYSFFHYYLYQAIKTANIIESFRYRIENEQVFIYDKVHATSTIGRDDHTFAFSYIPYVDTFEEFSFLAQIEIMNIRNSVGLGINENTSRNDVIHFSPLPWLHYKGVTHSRNFKYKESVPKITFGKYQHSNKNLLMPVSVNVHHALMDGYHVAQYFELFQELMNEK